MSAEIAANNQVAVGETTAKRAYIDWQQAEHVLGTLLQVYEANQYPYNQDSVRLPQDPRHMPESLMRDTKEHAMFLWSVCYYMRGGIKSVDAFKSLAKVYDEQPQLFNAGTAAMQDQNELGPLLKSYGLGYQHMQIAGFWKENAKRMEERWQGDPRRIFEGVSTYEDSLCRIKNDKKGGGFLGFQEKMVSMITYYLMDDKLIEPYIFPLPVDLHVMRVSVETEMLKFDGCVEDENILSEETLALARHLYYTYALTKNVDPLRLCDAVWLLSQSLCSRQPGNTTLEPNGRASRNGRKTHLVPLPVDTNDPGQQADYDKSCGSCPIEADCVWNVPSKTYYVQGELRRRGRRVRFPTHRLFSFAEVPPSTS